LRKGKTQAGPRSQRKEPHPIGQAPLKKKRGGEVN